MEKKNSVDYFEWVVESTEQAGNKITATITGFTKRECIPFSIKAFELEQDINNRMNSIVEEEENTNCRCEIKDSEYYKDIIARATNRLKIARSNNLVESLWNDLFIEEKENTNYTAMYRSHRTNNSTPEIKDIIFNPPATIVFWTDGTKTVVKCQNDEEFDPEKGITMAFFKKMHGNKGHYFEEIKKWCEPYHSKQNKELIEQVSKGDD